MFRRLVVMLVMAMMIAIAGVAYDGGIAAADGPSPVVSEDSDILFVAEGAFIEIGGVRSQIQTGYQIEPSNTTVPDAHNAEQGCLLPEIRLGGRLTPTSNVGHIVAIISADCSISITDITASSLTTSASTDNSFSDGGNRYKGYAKSELNDFAGIDLTSTYAEMYYYDDGSTVYGGENKKLKCGYFPDG